MNCKLPDKFKLLDKNMNELQFPAGVRASGIEVGSTARERNIATVEGIPGNINYGADFSSRPIRLLFTLTTKYDFDFSLMRNELYDLLTYNDSLYLVESTLPSRRIEISIDESASLDKVALHFHSKLEVNAETVGSPFWRTKYTTQDIENDGYSAIVGKYGMADGINTDYLPYKYTSNEFTVWNGGNVTIDPRNMELKIRIAFGTSNGTVRVDNLTTGEFITFSRPVVNDHLDFFGTKVLLGATNRLRDSNRKFISLVAGENKIKISNIDFRFCTFDFPYYYK